MADTVRFAIVGLGMGRDRAEKCCNTPGAELMAVCDSWEERGRAAEQALGVPWIADYDELLAHDDIDVIGLWTPSGLHATMALRAIETGKHVCMTKPMDIRLDICDAVIQAAEERGLLLAVDFDSRYNPVNHQIYDAIRSGAIGNIIIGDIRMKWFRSQDYYDGGHGRAWRSHTLTESGSLGNQGVHYVDLLQWWLGPINRIASKHGTYAHRIQTEDASVSLLEFASGALGAVITTTCSFPSLGTAVELTGTKGTIAWQDQEITIFQTAKDTDVDGANEPGYVRPEFAPPPEAAELAPEDFNAPDDLPANIIEDMVGAVREGKPVQCDGHEGRKTVQIIEAVAEASESGEWVDLG